MKKKIVWDSLMVLLGVQKEKVNLSRILGVLVFGALILAGTLTEATPLYSDGFEADTVGAIPAGWTHVQGWGGTDNGYVTTAPDPVQSGNNSFKIIDSLSNYVLGWKTSDFIAPTTGVVELVFSIYLQDTDQQVEALVSGNSAIYGGVFFRADGTLGYPSGGTWTVPSAVTYTANEWHTVRIVADMDHSTYSLFFDGTRVATAVPVYSATATFSEITLQGNKSAITTFYADDISIEAIISDDVFFDGFEYSAINAMPADWSHVQGWDGTANGVVLGLPNPVKTGDHAFKIIDSTDGYASGWKTSSFSAPTTGKLEWSFSIYLTATDQQVEALIQGNNATYGGVFFCADGTLGYSSDGTWTVPSAMTYTADEWHQVSIVLSMDSSRYSLFLDGIAVASHVPVYSDTATVGAIILEGSRDAVTSFYVDDVRLAVVIPTGTVLIIQ